MVHDDDQQQAKQGEQGAVGLQIAQAHVSVFVGHDDARGFQADQSQEQTDAAADGKFQSHRNGVNQGFTDVGEAQGKKQQARHKYGGQSHLPRHSHAQTHGVSEISVQAHAWCQGDGVVCHRTHHKTAYGGSQTGGDKHRTMVHACFRQNQGIHDDDVTHGEKSGEACDGFGANCGAVFTQFKIALKKAA